MNLSVIIAIVLAALWALGVFMGLIGKASKPAGPQALDSSAIQSQAQKSIDDTEEKRKQMMDDMQQKMQDMQQQNN